MVLDQVEVGGQREARTGSGASRTLWPEGNSENGQARMKVRHYGKHHKELTGLYLSQEIHAHNGSIWTIKFSLDGHYMASAGEDLVIHVWQVLDHERRSELHMYRPEPQIGNGHPLVALVGNGSAEQISALECMDDSHWEKKRRAKASGMRSSDNLTVPEQVFALSERPVCTFTGHLDEVLDLSWSESQYLLSSSMDKTVRLWHFSSNSCLKIFSHSDYVTCIQFNPIDDQYFISGSLDAKVRVWSIPNRQVVDWNDLHEMVTAASYTPDGQGAVVGSHKGNCHLYDTSDNKLLHKGQIDLQNKKKKSNHRKITGFQFAPGSLSEVVVTSADSRIRVINGCNVIHKFKGFRNTSSQISACVTANGKYVISASEDSYVYVWKYDAEMRPCRSKSVVSVTRSYEHFRCPTVTAAVPWPGFGSNLGEMFAPDSGKVNGPHALLSPAEMSSDSVTWPHEKLPSPSSKHSRRSSRDLTCGTSPAQIRSAWGMVIVTSSRGGEIRIYQNFGLPDGV
ncbi:hypothetical protein HPP92_021883 [Vanilla planifolia]|uniref:WD repeat-containing protein 44 n=1 Tax=Vanilla planifolia TaxID=51239 RepID=A0A835UF46_VANPL|nr:hypothetical protein HPP92_021883 [Vanilla planifolia]